MQRNNSDSCIAVRIGILFPDSPDNGIHLSLGLLQPDARLEACHYLEIVKSALAQFIGIKN